MCVSVLLDLVRDFKVAGRCESNPPGTSTAKPHHFLSLCVSSSFYHFVLSLQRPNDDEAMDSTKESEEHYLWRAHTHTNTQTLFNGSQSLCFCYQHCLMAQLDQQ